MSGRTLEFEQRKENFGENRVGGAGDGDGGNLDIIYP